MAALSKDGGPTFGSHASIWAGEWTPEGAERVESFAAVNEALVRDGLAFLREGEGTWCALMKEPRLLPGQG